MPVLCIRFLILSGALLLAHFSVTDVKVVKSATYGLHIHVSVKSFDLAVSQDKGKGSLHDVAMLQPLGNLLSTGRH